MSDPSESKSVSPFVDKIWKLIVDPETDDRIRWSKDGRRIIITDQERFSKEILPLHFKHRNFASFIRQLNHYGFKKHDPCKGLNYDCEEIQFYHPFFRRNCAHLLENLKRKSLDKSVKNTEGTSNVLGELKALRESLESKISVLEQENEARERDVHYLRQKCAKHEQILKKLLQFISSNKETKLSKAGKSFLQLLNDFSEESESRPVINELDNELSDEANGNESILRDPLSPCESLRSVKASHSDDDDPVPTQDPVSTVDPAPTEYPNPEAISLSYTIDFSNAVLNPLAGTTSTSTVINAVNSDGSQIVYHVTEVPESVTPTPKTATNDIEVLKPESRPNKRKSDATTSKITVAKFARTYENLKHKKITPSLENNGPPSCLTKTNYLGLPTVMDPTVISPQTEESTNQIVIDPLSIDNVEDTKDIFASDMPIELFEETPIIIGDTDLVGNGHCRAKNECQSLSQKKSTNIVNGKSL